MEATNDWNEGDVVVVVEEIMQRGGIVGRGEEPMDSVIGYMYGQLTFKSITASCPELQSRHLV